MANVLPLCPVFIQIDRLIIANLYHKTPILSDACTFAPCSFLFSYLSTYPSLDFPWAPRSCRVCANPPETAFGIPCFHAEFPVVRGVESSKEHSHPGNPGIPVRNVVKITTLKTFRPPVALSDVVSKSLLLNADNLDDCFCHGSCVSSRVQCSTCVLEAM